MCVPRHNSGKHQSSNAYANGSDQNCGNVITDRPTTRLHAPPGGHSSISFGADDAARDAPRSSRETQQNAFGDARSNVDSQVFGAPSDARAQSSNVANGADQNCGTIRTALHAAAAAGRAFADRLRRRRQRAGERDAAQAGPAAPWRGARTAGQRHLGEHPPPQ